MESSSELSPSNMGTRSTKLASIGWGLIVFAFIKPIVSAAAGSNAYLQGERIAQMLMVAVILILVLGLALRKRSPQAKNYGRIAVGVLLLGFSAWPIAQPGPSEADKTFIRESQAIQSRQVNATESLARRFNTVDLNGLLTPEALTNDAVAARARATLNVYRSLLDERLKLLERSNAEFENFFNTRSPSDADRRAALDGFNVNKALTSKMYSSLDVAQREHADVMEQILNWSSAQTKAKRLVSRNGQLVFASAAQQSELQKLLTQLQLSEKRVNDSVASAGTIQSQAQARMSEANRQAAELLRK